jgi:hypothetical protein
MFLAPCLSSFARTRLLSRCVDSDAEAGEEEEEEEEEGASSSRRLSSPAPAAATMSCPSIMWLRPSGITSSNGAVNCL